MYSRIVGTLFGCVVLIYGAQLPPEIEICKISNPNFKKCLISSAEKAFVVLANGNRALNIRPLDPLRLDEVIIEPIPGPINIYQKYSDVVLKGASAGKVEDFGIDFDNCRIWLNHTIKPMRVETNYELKGHLLLLPINAEGKLISVTQDLRVYITATCEKFTTNKKNYLRILKSNVSLIAKDLTFDFGVLINGNPQLDKELHNVIDDNPEEFFEVLRPSAEALWNAAVFDMLSSIFSQVPLEKLFKE